MTSENRVPLDGTLERGGAMSNERQTVLFVDDDPNILEGLKTRLHRQPLIWAATVRAVSIPYPAAALSGSVCRSSARRQRCPLNQGANR